MQKQDSGRQEVFYAGIGSRSTPEAVLAEMRRIGEELAREGFVLRSGAAPGADAAFEGGCDAAGGEKQVFVPWNGFQNRTERERGVTATAGSAETEVARKHHPAWGRLGYGARKLMARNSAQILGPGCAGPPTAFVVGWTPGGSGQGGTGQAYRIAAAQRIPVVDLALPWERQPGTELPPKAARVLKAAAKRLEAARKAQAAERLRKSTAANRTPAAAATTLRRSHA